ncbi:hypothetical protein Ddye_018568, partial [Dipteronia dyeriana]
DSIRSIYVLKSNWSNLHTNNHSPSELSRRKGKKSQLSGLHLSSTLFLYSMEDIEHGHVQVRGMKLHVAQIGTGPKIEDYGLLFCYTRFDGL